MEGGLRDGGVEGRKRREGEGVQERYGQNITPRTSLVEVLEAHVVHREEPNSGPILRAHVGYGGPVSYGQLGHTRTKELHKLVDHTHLTKVL